MSEFLLNPAVIMMLGGLLALLVPKRGLGLWALIVPAISLASLLTLPSGENGRFVLFGMELITLRIDHLSFVWSVIFHIAALLAGLYAWHVNDRQQQVAALIYSGSAIGAVLAGDLLTLFLYWEITALSSVLLIWASRTAEASRAGFRYLVIQVISGLLLMCGAMVIYHEGGSLKFDHIGLEGLSGWLIFFAFGIKCCFPLLHNWMQDAYPKATVTGTVVLSAFTTKLAVYALARGFAGEQILVIIGATMTAFPIFFAVIENDLRKVLAYSLNNQLGYMVVGVGIGTELAINGAAAHAFAHILYKALLFMSMGAVLYRVGTIKASELGGLYKSMPWTTTFCIIGALSISAFPLFSGFVTKAMILTAVAGEGQWIIWTVLLFASAGVVDHSGIKVPFFSFFYHDAGHRVKEAPWNMLLAMAITAFFCIGIGVYPEPLYAILPYPVDYAPYTTAHVITQLQLLLFAALAFTVLIRKGWYPEEIKSENLDFDWFYRKLIPSGLNKLNRLAKTAKSSLQRASSNSFTVLQSQFRSSTYIYNLVSGAAASTGAMVSWISLLLALFLLLNFL